ncbi:hypothetical protein LOD99_5543 [Oopsacas minuta]|uniref:Uncharacterized protein n=1 Tax=Oopsacas minuta TaxID=111878 RepID=A0AAV7JQY1_9METZ|nr:hypothetical protein LOD99_5543 [Oopsacas minuta]
MPVGSNCLSILESNSFDKPTRSEKNRPYLFSNRSSFRTLFGGWAFIHGNFACEDAPRSGRPNISHNEENVNEMLDLLTKDPHITYVQLEYEIELSSGSLLSFCTKSLVSGICVPDGSPFFELTAKIIAHRLL